MHAFDTARLHLRPMGRGDQGLYLALYADPEVMQHIAPPMTREAAMRSFESALHKQSFARQHWVVDSRDEPCQPIGIVGVFVDARAAEIGIMLLAPWRGGGRAGEVVRAMCDLLSANNAIDNIWARHAIGNGHASTVLPKLGFVADPMPGHEATHLRWSMTREHWLADGAQAVAT